MDTGSCDNGFEVTLLIFRGLWYNRTVAGVMIQNGMTLQNIRTHYSRPRNETIARVLFNLGYVNTLGSGVP